ncbi:ammonium transporter [Ancylostoma ceylanicum]|uniref:Ammonium transporter n=1 Tax=Ancylostoma ceylanicum TaxID=53326 RepID=A0A0D6M9P5_9BILA|nr:ammonium transporter [Ancylostoma ceylanicum]
MSGLVATLYLKPRQHRFKDKRARQISDPTKAILGKNKLDVVSCKSSIYPYFISNVASNLFQGFLMIWWGWLAFNTASNYSVSRYQWTEGMRSAVGTIMASAGGGTVTVLISRWTTKKIQVDMLIDGMLASLVSSTAGCLFFTPWQATLVGAIGSAMALLIYPLLEKAQIDDPVGVVPVHVVGSVWGMISPAIFVCRDFGLEDHQVSSHVVEISSLK